MEISPQTSTQYSAIQGDPPTRLFGIFFFGALAIITIGAGIGIGVGNLAHYKYFGVSNYTNTTYYTNTNITTYRSLFLTNNDPLLLPSNERSRKRDSLRKAREIWSIINPPSNNRRW